MTEVIEYQQKLGDEFILWTLLDAAGQPVTVGATLQTSRAAADPRSFKVTSGTPPHHEASSGRIYGEWIDPAAPESDLITKDEYFPHVFACKWVKVEKTMAAADVVAPAWAMSMSDVPLTPEVVLAGALSDMVREMVRVSLCERLPEMVRLVIDDLADAGHFQDMANSGDFDDAIFAAIDEKMEQGEYMSGHTFDLSDHLDIADYFDIADYADEIREYAGSSESYVETAVADLLAEGIKVVLRSS